MMSHKVVSWLMAGLLVASFASVAHAEDRTKSEVAANCAHAANDRNLTGDARNDFSNGATAPRPAIPTTTSASVTRATTPVQPVRAATVTRVTIGSVISTGA